MNRNLAVIGVLVSTGLASVAEAQFRIGGFGGGVSVRAPFVSVDVLPYGMGTRVRAPFTSVDTRAFRYGYGGVYGSGYYPRAYYPRAYYPVPPVYPAPRVYARPAYPGVVYPRPDRVAPISPPQQPQRVAKTPVATGDVSAQLIAAAGQLRRSLSLRRDDSDIWLDYLEPDRIITAVQNGEPGSSLADLLRNYEGVIGNSTLASIQTSPGFGQTYHWLRTYVSQRQSASQPQANAVVPPSPEPLGPQDDVERPNGPTPAAPIRAADDTNGTDDSVEPEAGGEEPEAEEIPIPVPL